jgi:hypothetical protein
MHARQVVYHWATCPASKCSFYPYFMVKYAEAQRGSVTCPMSYDSDSEYLWIVPPSKVCTGHFKSVLCSLSILICLIFVSEFIVFCTLAERRKTTSTKNLSKQFHLFFFKYIIAKIKWVEWEYGNFCQSLTCNEVLFFVYISFTIVNILKRTMSTKHTMCTLMRVFRNGQSYGKYAFNS